MATEPRWPWSSWAGLRLTQRGRGRSEKRWRLWVRGVIYEVAAQPSARFTMKQSEHVETDHPRAIDVRASFRWLPWRRPSRSWESNPAAPTYQVGARPREHERQGGRRRGVAPDPWVSAGHSGRRLPSRVRPVHSPFAFRGGQAPRRLFGSLAGPSTSSLGAPTAGLEPAPISLTASRTASCASWDQLPVRAWSPTEELNLGPPPYQGGALTI